MGQPSWQSLRPNPLPMPHLRLGMDITMVVGQDITEDTEDTMDGEDTTDTPMDMDTIGENALLMPNLKLMPKLPLRLMLMPLPGIMGDTTDIPMDTDTVTGVKGLL